MGKNRPDLETICTELLGIGILSTFAGFMGEHFSIDQQYYFINSHQTPDALFYIMKYASEAFKIGGIVAMATGAAMKIYQAARKK